MFFNSEQMPLNAYLVNFVGLSHNNAMPLNHHRVGINSTLEKKLNIWGKRGKEREKGRITHNNSVTLNHHRVGINSTLEKNMICWEKEGKGKKKADLVITTLSL